MSTLNWSFFTNHFHVLICLARKPDQPLRKVALTVGITERAVQRIIADLEEAGYLSRERVGRQNAYHLHLDVPLQDEFESDRTIGQVLEVMASSPHDEIDFDDDKVLDNWTVGEHGSEV